MMIENNLSNPFFVHCPSRNKKYLRTWKEIELFFEKTEKQSNIHSIENISLITWNNNSLYKSILEKSCDYFGIKYYILGQNIKDWNNALKIDLTLNFLYECKTKYVIGIDAYDAAMIRKLDSTILEPLKNNIKLIYNKTRMKSWPILDEFYGEDWKFNYLNAGSWIGETDFLKIFYEDLITIKTIDNDDLKKILLKKWTYDFKKSDQALTKIIANKYIDNIKLDNSCEIFEIIGKDDRSFSKVLTSR